MGKRSRDGLLYWARRLPRPPALAGVRLGELEERLRRYDHESDALLDELEEHLKRSGRDGKALRAALLKLMRRRRTRIATLALDQRISPVQRLEQDLASVTRRIEAAREVAGRIISSVEEMSEAWNGNHHHFYPSGACVALRNRTQADRMGAGKNVVIDWPSAEVAEAWTARNSDAGGGAPMKEFPWSTLTADGKIPGTRLAEAVSRGQVNGVVIKPVRGGWSFHPMWNDQWSPQEYLVAASGKPFIRRSLDSAWAYVRRCGLTQAVVQAA